MLNRIIVLMFVTIGICLIGRVATAQTWQELRDQVYSLSKMANYDSAIVICKISLTKIERQFGIEDTTTAMLHDRDSFLAFRFELKQKCRLAKVCSINFANRCHN